MATLSYNNPALAVFANAGKIDERAGVITGMSVITTGEAKGHGLFVDSKSLQTCLDAARSHKDGVLCKADHGTGVLEAIGALRNFRIDGDKLRADLHLLKSHPMFASIIEAARRMPHVMGLSIAFSYAPEVIDEKVFIRVKSLSSIDLVDSPACNTGMFTAKSNDRTKLAAAYLAAFGQIQFNQVVAQHGAENAHDIFERTIYYSGLDVPGYNFSAAKRHGERKALFGMQRVEASRQQAKIDACLSRLR